MDKEGSIYITAVAYEIPTHSCCPFGEYEYAQVVDLREKDRESAFVLISFHRLEMSRLYFTPISQSEMYFTPNTILLRQWQIFENVDLKMKY